MDGLPVKSRIYLYVFEMRLDNQLISNTQSNSYEETFRRLKIIAMSTIK